MSYNKMTYKQAVRAAVRDFNCRDWTKECDGKICTFDGISLRCGAHVINRSWCIEVEDDD